MNACTWVYWCYSVNTARRIATTKNTSRESSPTWASACRSTPVRLLNMIMNYSIIDIDMFVRICDNSIMYASRIVVVIYMYIQWIHQNKCSSLSVYCIIVRTDCTDFLLKSFCTTWIVFGKGWFFCDSVNTMLNWSVLHRVT